MSGRRAMADAATAQHGAAAARRTSATRSCRHRRPRPRWSSTCRCDRVVTITSSPSKGLEPTLELTERLAGHGYPVVPHLAARMISGRAELAEIVDRLTGLGVTRVFVPAGDAEPVGEYRDALCPADGSGGDGRPVRPHRHHRLPRVPPEHPRRRDHPVHVGQALHATHIVSNLTFSAAVVHDWITRMRARGVTVPVLLGVPGPVERSKLLAMATKIGVGESTRFLAKNKGLFARLAAPGGFTGERFVLDCARALRSLSAGVEPDFTSTRSTRSPRPRPGGPTSSPSG